jgi:release factor glutamine methyltransferase
MSTHSPFISTLLTVSALLKKSAELSTVSDTPRLDVEVLLSHILDKDRSFLYTWPEQQLNEQQQQCFDDYFQRRSEGEPVAHIIGQREFWSLPFKVTPATLIPRPETELLVELALGLPVGDGVEDDGAEVIDLGTGTGAIALALASEKNHWQITAVDAVPAAVQLAEENRQQLKSLLNKGFANVQVFQSDWFAELKGQLFDVIVSNPPYICEGDQHLKQGDVRFEPLSALVADEQGLSDLQAIINGAQIHLKPNGWLLLEHGFDQGAAVQEMMRNAGYESVATHTDLAGKDRVSLCCKSS